MKIGTVIGTVAGMAAGVAVVTAIYPDVSRRMIRDGKKVLKKSRKALNKMEG